MSIPKLVPGSRSHDPSGKRAQSQQPEQWHGSTSGKLAIKTNRTILLIDPSELVSVEADRNYVRFECENVSYHSRETMSVIVEKLKPFGFIQIHRSALVNSRFIQEIRPLGSGEYEFRMRGGRQFIVTRSYRKNLSRIAASWIGSGGFR